MTTQSALLIVTAFIVYCFLFYRVYRKDHEDIIGIAAFAAIQLMILAILGVGMGFVYHAVVVLIN